MAVCGRPPGSEDLNHRLPDFLLFAFLQERSLKRVRVTLLKQLLQLQEQLKIVGIKRFSLLPTNAWQNWDFRLVVEYSNSIFGYRVRKLFDPPAEFKFSQNKMN